MVARAAKAKISHLVDADIIEHDEQDIGRLRVRVTGRPRRHRRRLHAERRGKRRGERDAEEEPDVMPAPV